MKSPPGIAGRAFHCLGNRAPANAVPVPGSRFPVPGSLAPLDLTNDHRLVTAKTTPATKLEHWLLPLLVAVITVLAFLPVLDAGFVSWDDDKNFTDNPLYRGLGERQLTW